MQTTRKPVPSRYLGDGYSTTATSGSDAAVLMEAEWSQDRALCRGLRLEPPAVPLVSLPYTQATLEMTGDHREPLPLDGWSQDGDSPSLGGCAVLQKRWVLWHKFMNEHSRLDAWLQLAERTVCSLNPAHVLNASAKEELRTFESVQAEAGVQLVRLDGLTQKNRTLVRLFHGAMRGRLLALTRDCGLRWDALNARVETATHRLRHFVSRWEEFEHEREELMMWLADMDLRLSEVEHLIGATTCDRMTELQSFQEAVCVYSGRVSALLERGEVLIQRSAPGDAQEVESQLQEVLLYCTQVFDRVGRLHTRLISMRLVFEDDWRLAQGSDSGCPSETLQEEGGALDKRHQDLPAYADPILEASCNSTPPAQGRSDPADPSHLLPHSPPSPSPPTLDNLVLEWDPSVDIGGSVSHADGDSSYFSATTGLCRRRRPMARDGVKRRSYLSSLGSIDSQSDITNQEIAELVSERWLNHAQVFPPVKTQEGRIDSINGQWTTSTPDGPASEPIGFDAARVSAWLGQSPKDGCPSLSMELKTPCSKAVQTDLWTQQCSSCAEGKVSNRHDNIQEDFSRSSPSPSHALSNWRRCRRQSNLQSQNQLKKSSQEENPYHHQTRSLHAAVVENWWSLPHPAFLYLFLGLALTLLASLAWGLLEPDCQRSSRLAPSFQLVLRYVNGPPPT